MEKAKAKAKFNVEKAKAKLQEVLNAESDNTCLTNRIATTRYPAGGSDVTNTVSHTPLAPMERRGSHTAHLLRKLNSRTAY
ncbi:uncharacterized protein E0L32_006074 [Thyridium curvatum]|uniref:Uncharacterized protein n=1 Tax=Thyridium curvatum TaxID=1093900 RepID=A0A507B141_9PEZI|nr:uncharacterized protein E0L32_006074 [Thyridium curvatum]TPX13603.1 hypothetical protein E0L32_006074 [Thyridium curvatum]